MFPRAFYLNSKLPVHYLPLFPQYTPVSGPFSNPFECVLSFPASVDVALADVSSFALQKGVVRGRGLRHGTLMFTFIIHRNTDSFWSIWALFPSPERVPCCTFTYCLTRDTLYTHYGCVQRVQQGPRLLLHGARRSAEISTAATRKSNYTKQRAIPLGDTLYFLAVFFLSSSITFKPVSGEKKEWKVGRGEARQVRRVRGRKQGCRRRVETPSTRRTDRGRENVDVPGLRALVMVLALATSLTTSV